MPPTDTLWGAMAALMCASRRHVSDLLDIARPAQPVDDVTLDCALVVKEITIRMADEPESGVDLLCEGLARMGERREYVMGVWACVNM